MLCDCFPMSKARPRFVEQVHVQYPFVIEQTDVRDLLGGLTVSDVMDQPPASAVGLDG